MKIFPITEELLPAFSPLLPDRFSIRSTVLLGANCDGVNCGVIALNIMGERASICWFWVAPAHRRHGVGEGLLHQACVRIFEKIRQPIASITVSYPFDADWTPVMELMLSREGFLTKALAFPHFRLTREELESAPVLSPNAHVDWHDSVFPYPTFQRHNGTKSARTMNERATIRPAGRNTILPTLQPVMCF